MVNCVKMAQKGSIGNIAKSSQTTGTDVRLTLDWLSQLLAQEHCCMGMMLVETEL